MFKYPLATSSWDEKEKNAAKSVIESGFCTMGEKVKIFEQKFAEFVGSKYAIFSNSGSSANLLAISALLYRKGKEYNSDAEIIVPAVSWSTTFYPIHQCGFKMIFIDVDKSLNINCSEIYNAITPKTKAIFAVNLLGNPCNLQLLKSICKNYNLDLIIDNCESMGALYENKEAGTHGLMGTYSTFFSHHMSSIEGGFTVTDDEELRDILISLRAHGWTRQLSNINNVYNKDGEPFNDLFRFVLPGYNVRPNEVFAAIGLEQLNKLPDFISQRIQNKKYLENKIYQYPNIIKNIDIQQEHLNTKSSSFGFAFILKNKLENKRLQLAKYLLENGIESRPIVAGDFTKNPVIKWLKHEIKSDLKYAKYIDINGLFIGNNPINLEKEIDLFLKTLNTFIESI